MLEVSIRCDMIDFYSNNEKPETQLFELIAPAFQRRQGHPQVQGKCGSALSETKLAAAVLRKQKVQHSQSAGQRIQPKGEQTTGWQ